MGTQRVLECSVEPEWIDYNGHMNVAYYVLAFDRAVDAFLDGVGMDAGYRERTGCTVFTLELHVCYLRELKLGEELWIDFRLIDHDAKRLHFFLDMHHAASGELAATMEQILMHMDAGSVRATAMPPFVTTELDRLHEAQRTLPPPPQLGSRIGIRRR